MIFAFLFVNFDVGKEDLTLNLNLEDEEQKSERKNETLSLFIRLPLLSHVYPFIRLTYSSYLYLLKCVVQVVLSTISFKAF